MEHAHEIQCPNCGANDAAQWPNSPAMFRCLYCRTTFTPKFDMRPHVRPEAPPQSNLPSAPAPGSHPLNLSALSTADTASRYTVFGLLALVMFMPAAPIVWFVGYREARSKGENPGALLVLSLVFGLPFVGLFLFIVIAIVASAAK